MQAKKILVPTDFSPSSEAALDTAATLARGSGGKLLIVYVEEPPVAVDGIDYLYSVPEPNTDEALRRLKEVVPKENVPYEHRILKGTVTDAILNIADSEKADVIVMGTHGRRGITALLMGSVAEAVVRRAKCPVLTVKAAQKPIVTNV